MDNVVPFPLDGRPADHGHPAQTTRRRLFASGVIRRGTDPRASVRLVAHVGSALVRLTTLPPDGPRAA